MSENFKTCFVQFVKLKLIYKGVNFDALAFLKQRICFSWADAAAAQTQDT